MPQGGSAANDPMSQPQRLGVVTAGSLKQGLTIRLDPDISPEALRVGQYVTIRGEERDYLGIVTDIGLDVIDPALARLPPDLTDAFTVEVLRGTAAYGVLTVLPQLAVPPGATEGDITPAKTVPAHYRPVWRAAEGEFARVFGADDRDHISIGTPLDMEVRLCLDHRRLVERSNGVFGKSGTGKTTFTRLMLACLIQKRAAVNLVFDMHNEYGWEGTSETYGRVKGLKQLYGPRVAVFTLDEQSARRRNVPVDHVVRISYSSIVPEDMFLLREPLSLHERGLDAIQALAERYGDDKWLGTFLKGRNEDILPELKERGMEVVPGTLRALRQSLRRLERYSFLTPEAPRDLHGNETRSVELMLRYLEQGTHVVLEFGGHQEDIAAYVLVANLITRRLHERYVERTEAALGDRTAEPPQVVITLEEAHRFLSSAVAGQTIFGRIAREMRKYHVTLLVIDQRPSAIDLEVMSQMGTKVAFLLDDERDVEAVLAGVAGRGELRAVLARLESREQVLLFGHALPMPVVARVREYGSPESYRELAFQEAVALGRAAEGPAQLPRGAFG